MSAECPLCYSENPIDHHCPVLLERQVDALAELSALQSAAALGHLQPAHPYTHKPLPPVEEALRLRRALYWLAHDKLVAEYRGRCDVEESDIQEAIKAAEKKAEGEIPIQYQPAEPEKGG